MVSDDREYEKRFHSIDDFESSAIICSLMINDLTSLMSLESETLFWYFVAVERRQNVTISVTASCLKLLISVLHEIH